MSEMVDRVTRAIDNVTLVFSMGDFTGNVLRWVIWDSNRDTDDEMGWVWKGRQVNLDIDTLENPPGDALWALKDFKGRAAIAAMREPTMAMINDTYPLAGGNAIAPIWRAMIDAALKDGPTS